MTHENSNFSRVPGRVAGEGISTTGSSKQWPPFEAGHTLTLRHGAYSERTLAPVEAELRAFLQANAGHLLAEPLNAPAVHRWLRAEARCLVVADWLDRHDLFDDDGALRPAVAALDRFERSAAVHAERLGLDPRSRMALMREAAETQSAATDLADLLERGRQVVDAQEAPQ